MILTGLPATGKSTLGAILSRRLSLPLISKDDIKETIADSLGTGNRSLSREYGLAGIEVQFTLLRRCLEAGISAIAETFFYGEMAANVFGDLVDSTSCNLIQIVLLCDYDIWLTRYTQRQAHGTRHSIHNDTDALREIQKTLSPADYRGIDLDCPTLHVNADDPGSIDVDEVCVFIQRRLT